MSKANGRPGRPKDRRGAAAQSNRSIGLRPRLRLATAGRTKGRPNRSLLTQVTEAGCHFTFGVYIASLTENQGRAKRVSDAVGHNSILFLENPSNRVRARALLMFFLAWTLKEHGVLSSE